MGERPVWSMKNVLSIALLLAVMTISVTGKLKDDLDHLHYPDCDWHHVEQAFGQGRHHSFYPVEEVHELFLHLHKKYPQVMSAPYTSEEKTRPGRQNLYVYAFTSQANATELDLTHKPGIIFTAAHRADEPMTVNQVIYIAINWVWRFHHRDPAILNYLQKSVAWFIPIVNPDGYKDFLTQWKGVNAPPPIRKNRLKRTNSKCNATSVGVDLNRNYDINWKEGTDECAPDFPGEHEFSEVETQFVHSVVHGHRDIKLAVNFMGAKGSWRMPHNVTHLHHGHDLYHEVHNVARIDLNDTFTGLTGDVTDWMYFKNNITAFSALIGIENENGSIEYMPTHTHQLEMYNKTTQEVEKLYSMLPPALDHDFTTWQNPPARYIPEPAVNASKYHLCMVVQAFNKGLAPLRDVHIGIQMNNGIHLLARNSDPFHMHYELISESQITRANDNEIDYTIKGKFTSGELKHHDVKPLHVNWKREHWHGHEVAKLYSNEAITIPERHFLRVYVLIHRKVGKNVNADIKVLPVDTRDPEFILEHVTWTQPPEGIDGSEGLGGGAIFLIIMTIFLLLFVPLCVCYIYMKKTQVEREQMGDYLMHRDDKGVEML